ncbi:MAG: hypothetical protein EBY52_01975 [Actinobacteria bacterium]|nr:hypothetical protein [Actinomycetota bacterium]
MKVLLADALPDAAVERLEAAGDEVTRMPDLDADTLPEHIAGFEVLIVRSTKVTAAALDQADSLGLIDVVAVAKPGRSDLAVARAEAAGITFVDTLDELLTTSDIVSLHVPGSTDTKGMVDAAFLAKMKDGAVLLNTSRGDVVDEAALIDAMDNRGMRAGLDVYANEPGSGTAEFDSALAKHPSVVGTHHVGASTNQAQVAVTDGTIDTVQAYRAGEPVNCVNLDPVPVRAATLTVRHHDRVGVLASVLQILRKEELNVSNMQNRVFAGSKAAVASIDVGHLPSAEIVDEVQALEDVIYISVTPA